MMISKIFKIRAYKILLITLLLSSVACSSAPDETMVYEGEMNVEFFLGAETTAKFGVEANCLPCIIAYKTQATATIQETPDSFQINFTDFSVTQTGGPNLDLVIGLNSEKLSTGLISKLDENGQPQQAHHFNFQLSANLAGQTVNFDDLSISSLGRVLSRDTKVVSQPVITADQQAGTLKVTSLKKDIGTGLITVADPCGDCPCDFATVSKDVTCWEPPAGVGPIPPAFSVGNGLCSLTTADGLLELQVNNGLNSDPSCLAKIQDSDCGSASGTPITINGSEVIACQCQLGQLTTDINNEIQNISDQGGDIFPIQNPPFDCNR